MGLRQGLHGGPKPDRLDRGVHPGDEGVDVVGRKKCSWVEAGSG
jgi:hypothetical protein